MRLQVENLSNAIAKEYMVAALDALPKPKTLQKLHHAGKRDICVSVASKNLVEKFVCARHVEKECRSVAQRCNRWQAFLCLGQRGVLLDRPSSAIRAGCVYAAPVGAMLWRTAAAHNIKMSAEESSTAPEVLQRVLWIQTEKLKSETGNQKLEI